MPVYLRPGLRDILKTSIISLVLVCVTMPASAMADIVGKAVTVVNSWDEEDETSNSSASQYFDLRSRGSLGQYRLDIEASGRATAIQNEFDPGDDELNRLYSLALSLSDGEMNKSLTLGRQTVSPLTGPLLLDGASFYLTTGPFTLNTRWGFLANVTGDEPDNDRAFGIGFNYMIKSGMYLSMDYARTFVSGSLLTELLAADWSYSWHRYTKAYFTINYDLMSRALHELLLGARLFFSDRLTTGFQYSQNTFLFDSDSIYSVFAIDPIQESSFSLLFTPARDVRYLFEYAREHFSKGAGGRRYTMGARWTPGNSRLNGDLTQHKGFGGKMTEISLGASTPVLPSLELGIGGDIANTQNGGEDAVTSYTAFLGSDWTLSPRSRLTVRLERGDDETLANPTWASRLSFSLEL